VDRDAERRQRIVDRVDDRGRRADGTPLSQALGLGDGGVAQRLEMVDLERRNLARGRRQIVGERGGGDIAAVVVDDLFEQRVGDALGHAALDLAVDDHRIDQPPASSATTNRSMVTPPVSTSTSTIATWQALENVPAGSYVALSAMPGATSP